MLNNLLKRYKSGEIKDFYEYFQSSYFCAIYFDKFNNMEARIDQIINLLTVRTPYFCELTCVLMCNNYN